MVDTVKLTKVLSRGIQAVPILSLSVCMHAFCVYSSKTLISVHLSWRIFMNCASPRTNTANQPFNHKIKRFNVESAFFKPRVCILTLFTPWGGGGGFCLHGLWTFITFLINKLKPPNLVTSPKIYLGKTWSRKSLSIKFDVTMASGFFPEF